MFYSREEFQGIVSVLLTAERSLALYPSGHPRIQEALSDCFLHLRDLLQRERQIPIILAGREFFSGLEKTDRTNQRVLELFNWEEDPVNRYQMQRIRQRHSSKYKDGGGSQPFMDLEHECRERYAKLA